MDFTWLEDWLIAVIGALIVLLLVGAFASSVFQLNHPQKLYVKADGCGFGVWLYRPLQGDIEISACHETELAAKQYSRQIPAETFRLIH